MSRVTGALGAAADLAATMHFHDRAIELEARQTRPIGDAPAESEVRDFFSSSANVANREYHRGAMLGMCTNHKGIERFQPVSAAVRHQTLQRAINGGWCRNALGPQPIQQLVRRKRLAGLPQGGKNQLVVRRRSLSRAVLFHGGSQIGCYLDSITWNIRRNAIQSACCAISRMLRYNKSAYPFSMLMAAQS